MDIVHGKDLFTCFSFFFNKGEPTKYLLMDKDLFIQIAQLLVCATVRQSSLTSANVECSTHEAVVVLHGWEEQTRHTSGASLLKCSHLIPF